MRLALALVALSLYLFIHCTHGQEIKRVPKTSAVYCARWRRHARHFCGKRLTATATAKRRKFCRQYRSKCRKRRPPPRRRRTRGRKAKKVGRRRAAVKETPVVDEFTGRQVAVDPSSTLGQLNDLAERIRPKQDPSRDPFAQVFGGPDKSDPFSMGGVPFVQNPEATIDPFSGAGLLPDSARTTTTPRPRTTTESESAESDGIWGPDPFADEAPRPRRRPEVDSLGLPLNSGEDTTDSPPVSTTTDGTIPEDRRLWCERYADLGKRVCLDARFVGKPNYAPFCADFKRNCPFAALPPLPKPKRGTTPKPIAPGQPGFNARELLRGLRGGDGSELGGFGGLEGLAGLEGAVTEEPPPTTTAEPSQSRKDWDNATSFGSVGGLLSAGGIAPTSFEDKQRTGFGQFYGQTSRVGADWENGVYGSRNTFGTPFLGPSFAGHDAQTVEVPIFNGEFGAPIQVGSSRGYGAWYKVGEKTKVDYMGGEIGFGPSWGVPFIEHEGQSQTFINYGPGVKEVISRFSAMDEANRKVDEIIERQKKRGTYRRMTGARTQ